MPERSGLRRHLLPLLLMAMAPVSAAWAADVAIVQATAGADLAFARYIAGLRTDSAWALETVNIDAVLPKLEKRGSLRAIRRLLSPREPEYQVLELVGDQTVRQQVIGRYLAAEIRAAEIPANSVAVIPANYRFHYQGMRKDDAKIIYVFAISPLKKREGLIKGELWLDAETGAAVRQSGYLVKQPSLFIKRVNVIRKTVLCDGVVEARVTHLSIDTRLVGPAELTIEERPYVETGSCATPRIEER